MKIAIITLDGFNEIDSMVAYTILNRVHRDDWSVQIASTSETVLSMNGLEIKADQPLVFANEADVVIFGSGRKTLEHVENKKLLETLKLDPAKQFIGSQCSGALFLHKLGLSDGMSLCSDTKTASLLREYGCEVPPLPFSVTGNIFSAGGCLSSYYLAMWLIWKFCGKEQAVEIIDYVSPVGQKADYVKMAAAAVQDYL